MESREQLSESAVDGAIVALLQENNRFGDWLFHTCFSQGSDLPERPEFISAAASVWQGNGETDIVATWTSSAGQRFTLLIEDKLTAGFQDAQGARYAERAKVLRADGVTCRSLLMAPKAYLAGANPEARFFDLTLALEDVVAAAARCSGQDCPHTGVLARTCERVSAGGVLGAKGLHPNLYEVIAEECERRKSGFRITNNATDWIFFDHPQRVKGVEIRYRIAEGLVELAITPAFRGDRDLLMSQVRPPLVSAASGSYRFVRIPGIVEATPGERRPPFVNMDAARVVQGLELLIGWLNSYLAVT